MLDTDCIDACERRCSLRYRSCKGMLDRREGFNGFGERVVEIGSEPANLESIESDWSVTHLEGGRGYGTGGTLQEKQSVRNTSNSRETAGRLTWTRSRAWRVLQVRALEAASVRGCQQRMGGSLDQQVSGEVLVPVRLTPTWESELQTWSRGWLAEGWSRLVKELPRRKES